MENQVPDFLIDNKIRIIDENEKIGFANNKGQIIIALNSNLQLPFIMEKLLLDKIAKRHLGTNMLKNQIVTIIPLFANNMDTVRNLLNHTSGFGDYTNNFH